MNPGTKVGSFEIVSRLGAGGMGEVYRARDSVLGREVAIKILPEPLAAEPGRLERLAREARLLASLNHPNIAAIYAVETAGPVHALVLELVEGETLAARLKRKPLGITESRAIARQIVEALDAAHECGIVHRDLKPDNVMIGPRGTVKVLDFGIAKLATPSAPDPETVTAGPTADGLVIGTAAYMSPEQARGLPVDRRTDIWAFGCVLYEMLTARRAFGGSTVSDTIVATLERDPDWSALPADTPPGIRRLSKRCLEKDPRNRLRDIADGLPELDDAGSPAPAGPPRASLAWIPWTLAALAIAAAAWLARPAAGRRGTAEPAASDPLAASVLTPLTRDAGLSTTPTLSRDGRLLAYASDRGGEARLNIWVQQVAGGVPLRLTSDEADDTDPDFSPDGSQIVFHSDRSEGGVYVVPSLGGAPPRLVVPDGSGPRYSPDGSRIAYFTGALRGSAATARTVLFVASLSGGAPVRVAKSFMIARAPVWSPDGQALLFLGRSDDGPVERTFDWWLAKLDGSAPMKTGLLVDMAFRRAEVAPSAWTAEGVFFSDGNDLWRVPISTTDGKAGSPRRLTLSAGGAEAPSVSRDGRVVFASALNRRVVERVDVRNPPASSPPVQLYADFADQSGRPSQTGDGTTIVVERNVPGGIEILTKDLRSGRQQVIVRVDSLGMVSATISPDGSRISYTVGDPERGTGYVVETARGIPVRVCEQCVTYGFLSDGRRLIEVIDRRTVRLHDVVGGASTTVLQAGDGLKVTRPHISPDERLVAFRVQVQNRAEETTYVARLTLGHSIQRDEWEPIDAASGSGRPCGWSPDDRMVYLLLDTDGFRCLWGQRIGPDGRLAGAPIAIRHFHEVGAVALSTSYGESISPQGFLYGTLRSSGNIWSLVRRP